MLLVTGDLSTTQFHLPIHIGLLAFAICTFTLYLAAGDLPLFHHPFAPHLLIASFSCGRFFEAHLVTSAYRIIATDFLPADRENAARAGE